MKKMNKSDVINRMNRILKKQNILTELNRIDKDLRKCGEALGDNINDPTQEEVERINSLVDEWKLKTNEYIRLI